jgi:hypothetical protein
MSNGADDATGKREPVAVDLVRRPDSLDKFGGIAGRGTLKRFASHRGGVE